MAETSSSGKGLKKKLGPLPLWGWGASAVGVFLVYRYLKARNAAAAAAASGLSGGSLPPNAIGNPPPGSPGSAASGAGTFSSIAAWEQAGLTFLVAGGLSPGQAFNSLNNWLQGNCVSQAAYNALSAMIVSSSVGLPPGYSNIPTLTVCPATAQTPTPPPAPPPPPPPPPPAPSGPGPEPNLPANVVAAMQANGESVVDTIYNPFSSTWLYLTNRGGVYALGGSGFFGSLFDLNPSTFTGTGRRAVRITANSDGGYTITDQFGENYTFGPSANYAGRVNA
jgi:hypothetical protein